MNILTTGMGWINHTPGGLNRYYADYIRSMTEYGHQVTGLITTNGGEAHDKPAYLYEAFPGGKSRNSFSRVLAFRSTLRDLLRSGDYDVFNPHFALYSSLVTRSLLPSHVPIITHFHGPWAQESLVEGRGNQLSQQLRIRTKKSIEEWTYRRSDRFIVLSQYFRDILSEEYGVAKDRITIIPGAVDIDMFHPSPNREQLREEYLVGAQTKVLFCIRRLVKRMGIDNLLRAAVDIVREHPNVKLWIAGDGPLREPLMELSEQLGIRQHVEFLGRVSQEELIRRYQAADLSVVPTVTLEGFGLVTVESLACGTPVAGTPYGGTKEILEPFSPQLLFQDHSSESIAASIIQILNGHTKLPERQACRDYVWNHYTWKQVVSAVSQVFEEAVLERRGVAQDASRIL